jgi:hypothetical protein
MTMCLSVLLIFQLRMSTALWKVLPWHGSGELGNEGIIYVLLAH